MNILNNTQIKKVYFDLIGGYTSSETIYKEFKDYKGEERVCIACTQLDSHHDYLDSSERDRKRILKEWIGFLNTNPKTLKALHFNSHVPKALFDAACCPENLEELRFKWGSYSDLSALENLSNLKFLYIGPGSSVRDITSLGKLKSLVVLHIEAFKKIEDFSSLVTLDDLEQLVIWGPMLGRTPIKDLEFLREMPHLRSISISNAALKKEYTTEELADLRLALPNLHDIDNCVFAPR